MEGSSQVGPAKEASLKGGQDRVFGGELVEKSPVFKWRGTSAVLTFWGRVKLNEVTSEGRTRGRLNKGSAQGH